LLARLGLSRLSLLRSSCLITVRGNPARLGLSLLGSSCLITVRGNPARLGLSLLGSSRLHPARHQPGTLTSVNSKGKALATVEALADLACRQFADHRVDLTVTVDSVDLSTRGPLEMAVIVHPPATRYRSVLQCEAP